MTLNMSRSDGCGHKSVKIIEKKFISYILEDQQPYYIVKKPKHKESFQFILECKQKWSFKISILLLNWWSTWLPFLV